MRLTGSNAGLSILPGIWNSYNLKLGISEPEKEKNPFLPPGWIVLCAWPEDSVSPVVGDRKTGRFRSSGDSREEALQPEAPARRKVSAFSFLASASG